MRRIRNRRTRRFARACKRRGAKLAAAALAAGALGLGAGSAEAAPIGWTVGQGDGTYDAGTLGYGVSLDLDGDGNTDFTLSLGYGGYGGNAILLTPETVAAINNEVYVTDSFSAQALNFADPADVLTTGVGTIAAPTSSILWEEGTYTAFESGGFVGLIFEIPGGSPYLGYLDVSVSASAGLESLSITETALRAVPEPGLGLLLLSSAGLGGWVYRRRARG